MENFHEFRVLLEVYTRKSNNLYGSHLIFDNSMKILPHKNFHCTVFSRGMEKCKLLSIEKA